MTENGTAGFAFTETSVSRFTSGEEPMQDAGSAVLKVAWKHMRPTPGSSLKYKPSDIISTADRFRRYEP